MKIIQDFVSLIFPHYCRGCFQVLIRGEQFICSDCAGKLPRTDYHKKTQNDLMLKLAGNHDIRLVIAYLKFIKGGTVQNLLHHLKYENCPEVGDLLGRWYGRELYDDGFQNRFDLIVPVPLHPAKAKRRGYNQSESFARGLSEGLETEMDDQVLRRIRNTPTQTKKSRLDRWLNVKDAFQTTDRVDPGQKILVVDDIITTGATLEACAVALRLVGCNDVSIGAIASAV